MPYNRLIQQHVHDLIRFGFDARLSPDYELLFIKGLDLPGRGVWSNNEGGPVRRTSILVGLDSCNYPCATPGLGGSHPRYAIHVPYLAYNGSIIRHLHKCSHHPWYWLCFTRLDWAPRTSDLVALLQAIQVSLDKRAKGIE